jgi:hypothetical protein
MCSGVKVLMMVWSEITSGVVGEKVSQLPCILKGPSQQITFVLGPGDTALVF